MKIRHFSTNPVKLALSIVNIPLAFACAIGPPRRKLSSGIYDEAWVVGGGGGDGGGETRTDRYACPQMRKHIYQLPRSQSDMTSVSLR